MNRVPSWIVAILLALFTVNFSANARTPTINFSSLQHYLKGWIIDFEYTLVDDESLRQRSDAQQTAQKELVNLVKTLNLADRSDPLVINESIRLQNQLFERLKLSLADANQERLALRWFEVLLDMEPLSPQVRTQIIETNLALLNRTEAKLQLQALNQLATMAKVGPGTTETHQLRILDSIQDALMSNLLQDKAVQQKALSLVVGLVPASSFGQPITPSRVAEGARIPTRPVISQAVLKKRLQILFIMIHPKPEQLSANAIKALDDLIVMSNSESTQLEILRLYNAISHRIYHEDFSTFQLDNQTHNYDYDREISLLYHGNGKLSEAEKSKLSSQMIRALSKMDPVNGRVAMAKSLALAQALRQGAKAERGIAVRFLRLQLESLQSLAEQDQVLEQFQRNLMLELTGANWPTNDGLLIDHETALQVLNILVLIKPTKIQQLELQAQLIAKGLTSSAHLVRRLAAEQLVILAENNRSNMDMLFTQVAEQLRAVNTFSDGNNKSLDELREFVIDPKNAEINFSVRSKLLTQIVRLGSPAQRQAVQSYLAQQVLTGKIDCNAILKLGR